jgi:flavin-binding protein dodecin
MHSYKKKHSIGTSHPKSAKEAQRQAIAIALSAARKKKKKRKNVIALA